MTINGKITDQELIEGLNQKINEVTVVKENLDSMKENIDAALLAGQNADEISKKVGVLSNLTTNDKTDLVSAINSTENKVKDLSQLPNYYEWTANAGQLKYTLPNGTSYNPSVKSLIINVGGGTLEPSKVSMLSSTEFSLNLSTSDITAGMKVVARWSQPIVPTGTGSTGNGGIHHLSHELGGTDEINLTNLKGYQENVANKIGDTSKLETKVKTSLVDSVNEILTKSNTNLVNNAEISDRVGNLGSLETVDQSSIVNAINAINRKTSDSPETIGDLNNLQTVNKSSVVNAINENTTKTNTNSSDISNIGADNGMFWIPPTQPSMNWGSNGVPSTKDPELFLNAFYEPLRLAEPSYVTRTSVGKDQSNTYNVYRYEFTPKNYSKTIILSASTHGNEYTASFALTRFLVHLVNDWKNYPQLAYIRKNVRLIVCPMVNPWGFANDKRQNYNLVDLNRNTDYFWDKVTSSDFQVGGTNYKGTAPFSEVESKYYKQMIETYSEALAAIDFHNIVSVKAERIVYTSRYISQFRHIFNDTIDSMYKTGDKIVNGTSAVPTFHCWTAFNYGMTTANPEWYDGSYSSEKRGSAEMTEILKYFGNIIIKACSLQSKAKVLDTNSPFTKLLMYDKTASTATPITVSSTSYSNFNHTTIDMNIRRHGIMRASGYIKFTLSASATVGINPVLYQNYHPEMNWTNTKDANYNEIVQTLPAGTYVFPIQSRFNVFPTNYSEPTGTQRTELMKFRLRGKSTAGTLTLESFRVYLDYQPTDMGVPYEILDFTGQEAATEGSDFVKLYPIIAASEEQ
ncbi:M14 family metallopeptidase [Priestia megaterium]|uniref:M14 family metallopeptidase n=1 Tax=Priestia megaterium TaxID=1404 RepID=UPI002877B2D8|nr:M14 family metallopeptidase [Priestia megaterium]